MAINVMTMVNEAKLPHNQWAVLLCFADSGKEDGTKSWPGESSICRITGYSVQTVRRLTAELLSEGLIVQVGKGRRGRRAEFDISLDRLRALAWTDEEIASHHERLYGAARKRESEEIASHSDDIASHSDNDSLSSESPQPMRDEMPPTLNPPPLQLPPFVSSGSAAIVAAGAAGERSAKEIHDGLVFALADALGWEREQISEPQWGKLHRAAKDLEGVAEPEEIPRAVAIYRINFSGASISPNAIAANWAELQVARRPLTQREIVRAAEREESAAAMQSIRERSG